MYSDKGILFTPVELGSLQLKNRFIRSATYEGMADANGVVSGKCAGLYSKLAAGGVGAIITGFCYVSQQGRAMQPGQAGIANDEHRAAWQKVVSEVKEFQPEVKLLMQIAHTGRQTQSSISGCEVIGASSRKCSYFRQKVRAITDDKIEQVINDFVQASCRAKDAGFDGVQIHAAHGYLVHQFLSPFTNTRNDRWGERNLFLDEILNRVKEKCGEDYPVFVKVSHSDDRGLKISHTIETVRQIEGMVDAIEISYGTMECAMNIFRGGCPVDVVLKVNPLFNRIPRSLQAMWKLLRLKSYLNNFIAFSENYNLEAAKEIAKNTKTPLFCVGGLRSLDSMLEIVGDGEISVVSMCRPFICEPDLINRIRDNDWESSRCTNCNICAVNCDGKSTLECYLQCK